MDKHILTQDKETELLEGLQQVYAELLEKREATHALIQNEIDNGDTWHYAVESYHERIAEIDSAFTLRLGEIVMRYFDE